MTQSVTMRWGLDPDAVNTSLAELTLTENAATVSLDIDISATVVSLLLMGIPATISLGAPDVNVSAGVDTLTLTEYPASVIGDSAIKAVIYDGAFDYLLHTGGPTGASDGTTGTFVWSGTFNSDGSAMTLFDIPGTVPVLLQRQSDNTIDFEVGASGAVCSASTAAVAASLGFLIVLASFTGTTANLYVIHAAGTITGTPSAGSGASADLTADWYLGSDGGAANFLDADTAMWWADDGYIDFSDSNNLEEFWDTTNDLLRDPGSDGSNPSGAQPLVCHINPSASHATNAGSGGDADGGSNSGDGTSPGAYAADYSAGSPLSIAHVDNGSDSTNTDVYTFSSNPIGTASSDRHVIVSAHTEGGSTATVSSITVGGVSMALDIASGDSSRQVTIGRLLVTSGTAADIVVTMSGTVNACGIVVHNITGATSISLSDSYQGQLNATTDLAIPTDGAAVGAMTGSVFNACTWTGLTETADFHVEFAFEVSTATSTTPGSPSISASNPGNGRMALAAYEDA